MKMLLAMFVILMTTATFGSESCSHDQKNFRCVKFIRNYYADTVTFDIPNVHPLIGKKVNVRVFGVDAPELRTKNTCEKEKARHAKKLVMNLFKNAKRIDLENIERGKYFRVIADVKIDGESLTHYLLKNGLAYSYGGGAKKKINWCKSFREIASENKG